MSAILPAVLSPLGASRSDPGVDLSAFSTTYQGLSTTRTGSLYLASSATTARAAAAGDACYEDRGDGAGGGVWTFPSATNDAPNVLDFRTSAGWTHFGSPTVTTDAGVAPDGTSAQSVQDTAGASQRNVFASVSNAVRCASLWYYDSPTDPPSAPARIFRQSTTGENLPSASAWTRYETIFSGNAQNTIGFSPADPSVAASTGTLFAWGAQSVTGVHALPLLATGSSASVTQQLSVTKARAMIAGGKLGVEVGYIPSALAGGLASGWARETDGYLWSAETPDGLASLRYVAASKSLVLAVRGADVLTATIQPGETDRVARVLAWYDPIGDTCGIRQAVNGAVFNDATTTTTGGALAKPTSFYLGSNVGSDIFAARWTFVRPATATVATPEIVLIGDSIVGSISQTWTASAGYLYTQEEAKARAGVRCLAIAGHTIAQQKTALLAMTTRERSAVRGVVIQVGVNDIDAGSSSATVIAALQDLVTTCASRFPGASILLAKITPCDAYLSAGESTIRAAVNVATGGGGGSPITGADAVITSIADVGGAHTLNDGAGNLAAAYNSGDNLHPNKSGRQRIAAGFRAALTSAGVLP